MNIVKAMLKMDKQSDLLSETIKTIGLIIKATFDKNVGIDPLYIKSLIPLMSGLVKLVNSSNDNHSLMMLSNFIKTVGILGNHAAINPYRNISFYKSIIENKFIQ